MGAHTHTWATSNTEMLTTVTNKSLFSLLYWQIQTFTMNTVTVSVIFLFCFFQVIDAGSSNVSEYLLNFVKVINTQLRVTI